MDARCLSTHATTSSGVLTNASHHTSGCRSVQCKQKHLQLIGWVASMSNLSGSLGTQVSISQALRCAVLAGPRTVRHLLISSAIYRSDGQTLLTVVRDHTAQPSDMADWDPWRPLG
jgi:hypothetical protein